MIKLFNVATTHVDENGVERTAFRFTWEEVRFLLGRDYNRLSKDNGRIIATLLQMGAHEWVKTGEVLAREEDLLVVGPAIEYVPLARHSYHYFGYDNSDPWAEWGHTAVREPDPADRTIYADRYVTHIEMRPDVEIQTNDAQGASAVWGRDMPCPFVRLHDRVAQGYTDDDRLIKEAREWLLDAFDHDEDAADHIETMSAFEVILAVERHHGGGWKHFVELALPAQ